MFGARRVLCLDWDKRSLRIVSARLNGKQMELEDAHAHFLPDHVDAEDAESLGPFIKQMLHHHHIRLRHCIVDVPRERTVINRLKIPPTPPNELAAAVRFQAQRELPFTLEEAEVDFVIMQRDEQGWATEVLLAAVRREVLGRIVETCRQAGLSVSRVGLRPYANSVSVSHLPGMLDQRVLFVDVGPAMTEIDFIDHGTLVFSRAANVSVPFKGGELASDDSRVIAREDVETIQLVGALEAESVDDLVLEITRTLQAYRATDGDAGIDQIVIAGGTGVEEPLLLACEDRFELPTLLFEPAELLDVAEEEAPKLRSFAATLGLAWSMAHESLLELDFLHPKQPVDRAAVLRSRIRTGVIGAAAVVVLLSGAAWYDISSKNAAALELEKENSELREAAKALYEIKAKMAEAQIWEEAAESAVWSDHMLDLTQLAIDPGVKMIGTRLSINGEQGTISLDLASTDWESAQRYIANVDGYEVDGERVYAVTPGVIKTGGEGDKFPTQLPLTIRLVELQKLATSDALKKRERQYKKNKREMGL